MKLIIDISKEDYEFACKYPHTLIDIYSLMIGHGTPVKSAKWIRVDKDKMKCSNCDVIHFIAQYPNGDINYCPNCGAEMEVEE